MCAERGREKKTAGTPCSDTECQCNWREGYTPDGDFCDKTVSKCEVGKAIARLGLLVSITANTVTLIRSTSKSRPNNIRGGKCPSVRPSVHKKFLRFQ